MISHLSFPCSDLKKTIEFYQAVFKPLGFVKLWETESAAGFGHPGSSAEPFAIKLRDNVTAPGPGFHLAFKAPSHVAVDEFYKVARSLGAEDRGAPGLRPHYGPHYYAAFVLDPDGHHIEAVCQSIEEV